MEDLDSLVGNNSAPNALWLNDGNGHFTHSSQLELGEGRLLATGDLDNDGDFDAVTSDSVWLNDGRGRFASTGQNLGFRIALGDIDGDGYLDALAGGEAWINNRQGQFKSLGQRLSSGTTVIGEFGRRRRLGRSNC